MNKKLFKGEDQHRFTLFRVDPINQNCITPYVRFKVGGTDGVKDAEQSNAYYSEDMGYTGMAWQNPRTFHFRSFPKFNNREEFEYFYVNNLSIPREVVSCISDYMINVRHIFCYGFVDSKDRFLGVLSLDSKKEWTTKPEEIPYLEEMLGLMRTLLESLFIYNK